MAATCIEMFAGGGGATTGLHRAGFRSIASVEMWPIAAATLRKIGAPVIEGVVEAPAVVREIVARVKRLGSPALLWASPPCQPYSSAGLRLGELDPRDGWATTLKYIRMTGPRVVLIENVSDAPVADWAEAIREIGKFAYAGSFHLSAEQFGVPQSRKRAFVYAGPVRCSVFMKAVREHMRTPPPIDTLLPHLKGHFVRIEHTTAKARPASGASCPTLTTKGNVYVHKTDVGVRKPGYRVDREVSRPMTVEELAVIQGFPRDYPFQGSKSDAYKMIGNSVPPGVAEVMGLAARTILKRKI